ncbi:MAG: hypothetical protein R3249_02480, partial [Nitriliruptorales bacterium]|nr:hypothetical protein [Nitriliruptorales bacterium]
TLLAILSIVVRAFRARGDERQQLKWVGFGLVFGWGGAFLITILTGDGEGGDGILADSELAVSVGETLIPFFIFAMPATLLVAMFRYRLWDIDRIIRRTAAYAVVLLLLGAVYAVIVLALGVGIFGASQDGDVGSGAGPIPVALATLVAAGLFRPLQRRVKDAVDRRFNRRRYDAEQTIAAFIERLRDEVDAQVLIRDLAEVVGDTMQPDSVGVWLRTREAST